MLSRDLEKAKEAYKNKSKEASINAHQASATELHTTEQGKYIKSVVYGGLDGIITTFAVVAGVAGASLSAGIVLILGFANLIGDGLSMAIGDFLSSKAERDYNRAEYEREKWEVENYPEGEKKELEEIYTELGMSEADAHAVTEIISKHQDAWVNIMMAEELGIVKEEGSPLKNALATFFAFALFGVVPLLSFLASRIFPVNPELGFPVATALTGVTLFTLGAIKTFFTGQNWIKSGFEMLIVGGLAAGAAYGIGIALSGLA